MARIRFPASNDDGLPWTGERFVPTITGNIAFEHYHRYLFASQFCAGCRVLDIACGEGYGSFLLAQVATHIIGVDVAAAAVERAQGVYGAGNLEFRHGTCIATGLADASVDVVVSFETIEHIAEHDAFLAEIRRVLLPGGLAVFSTPDREVYSTVSGGSNPYHLRELSEREFLSLLSRFFAHTAAGRQKATCGSLILPTTSPPAVVEVFRRLSDDTFCSATSLQAAPYVVALASDAPLPPMRWGVLDDADFISTLQHRAIAEEHRFKKELNGFADEVRRLNAALGEQVAEVARVNDAIDARDHELSRLNAALGEQVAEVTRVNDAIGARDHELSRLNAAFAEQVAEMARLNEVIGVQDREVSRLNAAFADQVEEVGLLNAQLSERGSKQARLVALLAIRDREVRELNELLEKRAIEVSRSDLVAADLRRELVAVRASTSWRVTTPLRAMKTALDRAPKPVRRLAHITISLVGSLSWRTPTLLRAIKRWRERILRTQSPPPSGAVVPTPQSAALAPDGAAGVAVPRAEVEEATNVAVRANSLRPLVVIATHDCSLSGAPTLALNMVRRLVSDPDLDVLVVAKGVGPLAGKFCALSQFVLLGSDRLLGAAAAHLDCVLARFRDRDCKVAFCNTVVTGDLVPVFRNHGYVVLSLVHELPTSIRLVGEDNFTTIDHQANAIILGSEFMRERIVSAFAPSNRSLFIVPTGYPDPRTNRSRVNRARTRLRREAGFPHDSTVVLGCGTLDHRKGIDLFVQLAKLVLSDPQGEGTQFAWIGGDSSPSYTAWLKHDLENLGLTKRVRLLGPRDDIFPYLAGADVFVLPSREDPFPLVNLAAMAFGLPVVAFSGAGGAPEALGEAGGIVVPYLDVAAMAGAVVKLAGDPERRHALGRVARHRYETLYTMEKFLDGLFSIVTKVGGRPLLLPSRGAAELAEANVQVSVREMKAFSVVIPSYNHAHYVTNAIRSVLEQDYPTLELIVVDDGSSDGSQAMIRQALADDRGRRVTYVEQANAGAHAAISHGLSLATGEYLTILNSDDQYEPRRLSEMRRSLPTEGEFIAFTKVRFIGDDNQPLNATSGIQLWYDKALRDAAQCPTVGYGLLRNNFSLTSGNLVFSRSLYDRVGVFAPFRMCHDWDFLMRATHFAEPIFVQQVLMAYRVHTTNTLHSTQHLLLEEGVPAMHRFIDLGLAQRAPNRLAPGWAHWPVYFDYFIDTYASWFSSEPIRRFLQRTPEPSTGPAWGSWTDARSLGVRDYGYFNSNTAEGGLNLDALAMFREIALREGTAQPARPAESWDKGLARHNPGGSCGTAGCTPDIRRGTSWEPSWQRAT
jgi:glycosyltransferase involved in cell wall biosynthesis/SAM-dependent methyltransferase